MPRTKISKGSKRNREAAAKEEKLRDFERDLEAYVNTLEVNGMSFTTEIENDLKSLMDGTLDVLLNMCFGEVLHLGYQQLQDYQKGMLFNSTYAMGSDANSVLHLEKKNSALDDEESGSSRSSLICTAFLSRNQHGRTPGPLNSALARQKNRRSRSACSEQPLRLATATKISSNNGGVSAHLSRNKLRTPMSTRPKAVSADRSLIKTNEQTSQSPAAAFLRWPKPGEFVMSVHGSPLLAPIMPHRYPNVSIPTKNGTLSMQPKKLESINSSLIENIDFETLGQIKILHENLDLIVKMTKKNSKN